MSFPIRCFTCNKIIGCYEEKYFQMLEEGYEAKDVLDELKIIRYCCRRMFLGYVDISEKLLSFPKNIPKKISEKKQT
jgi:DNA-directed RNA polymerase subunit N (RpoN/RPB10)